MGGRTSGPSTASADATTPNVPTDSQTTSAAPSAIAATAEETLHEAIQLAEDDEKTNEISDEALTEAYESATISAEVQDQNMAGIVDEVHDSIEEVLIAASEDESASEGSLPGTSSSLSKESMPGKEKGDDATTSLPSTSTTATSLPFFPEISNTIDLGLFGSFWLQTARAVGKAEEEEEGELATTSRPEPVFRIEDYTDRYRSL